MLKEVFNFNEFCRSKACPYHMSSELQVSDCEWCKLVGVSFTITKIPADCIHLEEITAVKKEAKEKYEMWKKLLDVNDDRIRGTVTSTSGPMQWIDITDKKL